METLTAVQLNCQHLLDKPRVYADLNGGWPQGDAYIFSLNSRATESDMRYLGYSLTPGLVLDFWTDDGDDDGNPDPLLFRAMIQFDEDLQKWIGVADNDSFLHASEVKQVQAQEPALV